MYNGGLSYVTAAALLGPPAKTVAAQLNRYCITSSKGLTSISSLAAIPSQNYF